jgi:hypothetical protein
MMRMTMITMKTSITLLWLRRSLKRRSRRNLFHIPIVPVAIPLSIPVSIPASITQDDVSEEPDNYIYEEEASALTDDTSPLDKIFSNPVELGINTEVIFESDEMKASRFLSLIKACTSGKDLYRGVFTLSNTGTNHGFAIAMNRALKLLLQDKRVDADATGDSTFTKWKRSGHDKEIEKACNDLVVGDAFWDAFISKVKKLSP